ncbi:DUF4190 domain-containing protein [Dactylosporangium salmoneum]|uniref:DUF4190 domain-containing protein n=1 Tax=Dactylosporangium salmoneum TaxID=53361 RepID=A0ABN3GY48_9ACTN
MGYPPNPYPSQPQQQYPPQYPPQPQPYILPPAYAGPPSTTPMMRVDLVQGTPFGVAYPTVQSIPSGQAIGALVAGIASILVGLFSMCLGASGAQAGWGLSASGAFTVLGVFIGAGALILGLLGNRRIRQSAGQVTGRGMAISGIVLGAVGVGLALFALLLAAAL